MALGAVFSEDVRMYMSTSGVSDAPTAVRAAAARDVVPIHALALDNALFAPDDMAGFTEMLRSPGLMTSTGPPRR